MEQEINLDTLRRVIPRSIKVTQKSCDNLNSIISSSDFRDEYKEAILDFSSVLNDSRWTLKQYAEACKFVVHKLQGDSNLSAHVKTFPDKYQDRISKGVPVDHLRAYAQSYSNNKLVLKIMEQTIVPLHLLNLGVVQEAINVQIDLMQNANSETVRQKAADSLISHLKTPEIQAIQGNISVTAGDDIITKYEEAINMMVTKQQEAISGGANVKDIANTKIEFIDVEEEEA
jgi:hypothetical protein